MTEATLATLEFFRNEFKRAVEAKAAAVEHLKKTSDAAQVAMYRRDAAEWVHGITGRFKSGLNNFAIPAHFSSEQIELMLELIEKQPEKAALKLRWDCWTCNKLRKLIDGAVTPCDCSN